jgi:coenzyme F420-reducing hydrogenase alpha subunit
MRVDLNIDIHHLTRIEGHGDIRVRVSDGVVKEARWDVVETPRFFEVMLKGKHYTSAGILAARICGICSITHCLASIRATENAFGVVVPDTARKLRLLALHGETLQSHLLHVLFLALPDYLCIPSVMPLLESKPELVKVAARLKGLANDLSEVVAGRSTHPVSLQVGGVAVFPEASRLLALKDRLERSLTDLSTIVGLFMTLDIPKFERETEFVSIKGKREYPSIGGRLISSDGVDKPENEYKSMTNEYVDKNSTSKLCRLSRESFAVGALARFNNNHSLLHPEALATAEKLGLVPGLHNPFMNNAAQIVECVHITHHSIRLIEKLLEAKDRNTMIPVTSKAGEGIGAVEAPRGVLYHHYEYDNSGRVIRANCVIPTTQNNANIRHDLHKLVEEFSTAGKTDKELELLCSMLVRAYDPCLSCSVH